MEYQDQPADPANYLPQRREPIYMTCVCRLTDGKRSDSCACTTSGPDEPVCQYCVAAGHPQDPGFAPIIKGGPHAGARVPRVRLP